MYERLAATWHDSIQQPRYIYGNIKQGDLVWTRDPDGQYFLARVKSGWEYWTTPEGREMDIDIANIFRCVFHEVPLDAVPGRVISNFGFQGRSIQKIRDPSVRTYSQHLWNSYSGEQVYDVDMADFPDIFAMLDPEETEDLVFLYLQSRGWYVVPNSRKVNTPRFEFILANARTGEKALTQVKTGNVRLNFESYCGHPWHIFLFQSNEYYDGQRADNVTCISRGELAAFLKYHIHLFPQSSRKKLDMIGIRQTKFPMQRVKQNRPTGCGFACIAMLAHTTYEEVQQHATRLKLSIGSETRRGSRTFPCHLSKLAAAYGLRFSDKVKFSHRFRDNGLSLTEFECHMRDRNLACQRLWRSIRNIVAQTSVQTGIGLSGTTPMAVCSIPLECGAENPSVPGISFLFISIDCCPPTFIRDSPHNRVAAGTSSAFRTERPASERRGSTGVDGCEESEVVGEQADAKVAVVVKERVQDGGSVGDRRTCMMTQLDLLTDREHPYSEIANESTIEAIYSLNSYMDYKGVSFMVGNGAARSQEVGVTLRPPPDPACLHGHRRESSRRRDAVRRVREVGHSRGPCGLRRAPEVGGHHGRAAPRVGIRSR